MSARARLSPLLATVAVLSAIPTGHALAAPAGITLVACAPGFPGTTAETQPAMDALAAVIARAAALPAGTLGAVYLPGEPEGAARLARADAAVALLSLPFFLEHGGALGLAPRLQVQLAGAELLER